MRVPLIGPLIGRGRDIAAIRAFVDQVAVHGGALVVSGEAGVGKTAVIEAATSYAVSAGLRLLRATGAQFEASVSFSGLHQLLFPLLDAYLDQLDEAQRTALRSALGLHQGAAPDWMTLSHAALELLTRAASGTPILIVVDDVPWLDQASGRVLAFIARRTAGTRCGVLATMRIDVHPLRLAKDNLTAVMGVLKGTFSKPMPDGKGGTIAPLARRSPSI